MKNLQAILTFLTLIALLRINKSVQAAKYDVKELQCLVCQATLNEFEKALNKIDPSRMVEVGGYRIDAKGNYQQKTVSEAKSETKLSELLDEVCNKMDDYVRATWKNNGQLTLLKMVGDDGKMNSDMSKVDFIQDDDLNKSLKYYCELVLEEHEDSIINYYVNNGKEGKKKICVEESKMCKELLPDEQVKKEEL